MKFRKSAATSTDKVETPMTPMIDVVFQLLMFFLLSFKFSIQEGDFSIKMPVAGPGQALDMPIPPVHVRLSAGANGELTGIFFENQPLSSLLELNQRILDYVGTDVGPQSAAANAEVELAFDYDLRYAHVVEAITRVSGYTDPTTGRVTPLIEKLKFAPPQLPGEATDDAGPDGEAAPDGAG